MLERLQNILPKNIFAVVSLFIFCFMSLLIFHASTPVLSQIKMNLTVAQQEQMVMKLFSGLKVCPSPQESFGICQHYFETADQALNVLEEE